MLFSILDAKSEAFGRIFEARKENEAIRTFLTLIQTSTNTDLVGMYPQDFSLFKIGDFDVFTGRLSQEVQPVQLITGLEAVQMLKGINDTCSEVAVQNTSDESNVVALKSTSEEVNG